MNHSTDGVKLRSGFVFDVLAEYEDVRDVCAPAFAMVSHLDRADPNAWCEMQTYNDVCAWIEEHIGEASIREAGRAIGARAYDHVASLHGEIAPAGPLALMEGLRDATMAMIEDPHHRGWEIRDVGLHSFVMRKTQTFSCPLQIGLLSALMERTGVRRPEVEHVRCAREGAAYCDYVCRWRPPRAPGAPNSSLPPIS